MKVAIRTDASPTIGTGHLMRCVTLADALRAEGAEVAFLCAPSTTLWARLVEGHGHSMGVLEVAGEGRGDDDLRHSSWLPWGQAADAAATTRALSAEVDWLIVDHYALDARWERQMRRVGGKMLAIDDLADRRHDCSILLDQTPQSDGSRYDGLLPAHASRLLGPNYALLRPAFAEAHANRRELDGRVRRIVVFMGGTDPDGVTLKVLDALTRTDLAQIPIDVVIGGASPHLSAVQEAIARRGAAVLHVDTPEIAALFAAADLAIGSGGVAALERCCVGLASVTLGIADNQSPGLRYLHRAGAIYHLGDAPVVSVQALADRVAELCTTPKVLWEMGVRAAEVVDGLGVRRVIARLQECKGP